MASPHLVGPDREVPPGGLSGHAAPRAAVGSEVRSAPPRPPRAVPRRRNALVQVLVGLPLTLLLGLGVAQFVEQAIGVGTVGTPIGVLSGTAAALAGYYLVVARLMEGRHTLAELRPHGALRELLAGFGLGGGLLLLTVATIAVLGDVETTSGASASAAVAAVFSAALLPAVVEEIAFRGVLFRITERSLGSWWATLVSSVLFGAAHMLNPNATPWSTAVLVVEAGILLSALYVLTHRLWTCIGFHLAFNLVLGLLGLPNSGQPSQGVLTMRFHGPELLTGGSFGPEVSLVSALLMTGTGIVVMGYAVRRGRSVRSLRHDGRNAMRAADE